MAKKSKHKNSFLTRDKLNLEDKHKAYLGLDMPPDYFAKSKQSILAKVQSGHAPKKGKVIRMNSWIQYAVAASVAVLLMINLWLFNFSSEPKDQQFELLTASENVLLNSLFIEEDQLEAYANDLLFNEVVIKAELTEQKLDNFFINSLFVEDSLLDNYTEKEFLETIIL